jgi:hypothetical protein
VDNHKRTLEQRKQRVAEEEKDASIEATQAVAADAAVAAKASAAAAEAAADDEIMQFLAAQTDTDGLLQRFVELLKVRVKASNVYVGALVSYAATAHTHVRC